MSKPKIGMVPILLAILSTLLVFRGLVCVVIGEPWKGFLAIGFLVALLLSLMMEVKHVLDVQRVSKPVPSNRPSEERTK